MGTTYVLVGGAGYVAPKHYKAIKETGGDLLAILDPHDSVGIIDSYFKNCKYFREFERFDRFCIESRPDYVVVCSPNYLHDAHCHFGLRIGAGVICEKPLALNVRNIIPLKEAELKYGGRVWNILQLRLSPLLNEIRSCLKVQNSVEVRYFTPRGAWYHYSWKGDVQKSGGLFTNIGVHLLDLLLYLFPGEWKILNRKIADEHGEVEFTVGDTTIGVELSILRTSQPQRMFTVNGWEFDLSRDFGDLHTLSYEKILIGKGFGIDTVLPAIELCAALREEGL